MALLASALFANGCDDEGVPCGDLTDSCTSEGDRRCGTLGVETCGDGGGGCLLWSLSEACGPNQGCEASGGAAECVCDDECDDEGAAACDGDALTECVEGDGGCLELDVTDCAAFDASCDDSGAEAVCVLPCADDCVAAGETLCLGGVVAECVEGEGGCLDLELGEDCAEGGQVCDDSGEDAECVSVCENECAAAGDSQCDGDVVMTCVAGADGCLSLEPSTDCRDTLQSCEESAGDAACVGCGACDGPGEYCDDVADPPVCMTAGHVSEILTGVTLGTAWADLPLNTRRALEARAELTNSQYRALFGREALAAAIETMTTAPTAEELTNYAAFLSSMFGVDAVTNAELDRVLRRLYVTYLFVHQALVITYHYMPAVTWDGVTPITWFPSSDTETMAAYREMGAEVAGELQVLRHAPAAGLDASDRAVLEGATAIARQLRAGSIGYYFGDRTFSVAHSMIGWGWDFMLNYSEYGGAIFVDDDEFLDQLNAYYFAELIRVHEGTVPGLEIQYEGCFGAQSPYPFLVGDPATSRTAELYLVVGGLFRDRVLAHPDIAVECYPYSAAELASIWDAFTADMSSDNDGATTIATYYDRFTDAAAERAEVIEGWMVDGLRAVFPTSCAAMSAAERDAIIAAIESAATIGDAQEAFDAGLAAAGDGTAPAVLEAAVAGLTMLGGRDYADPVNGATWLAEDTAAAQAIWDDVVAWIVAEYGFDPTIFPADLIVDTTEAAGIVGSNVTFGIGGAWSLESAHTSMLHIANQVISDRAGTAWYESPSSGLARALIWTGVSDRFLADTLSPADVADLPLYSMAGVHDWVNNLAGIDATARQFLGGCGPDGVVDWVVDDVFVEWGVTEPDVEYMLGVSMLGTWYMNGMYIVLNYVGMITSLQARLDADYGPGTYTVDSFVLQRCGLFDPRDDDATYAALAACVAP